MIACRPVDTAALPWTLVIGVDMPQQTLEIDHRSDGAHSTLCNGR